MKTTTRTSLAGSALLALALLAGQTMPAHAQTPPCRFQLGFADLARLLGERAGVCREDQHVTPNGDAEQATSTGLLVWRKADNWTAFTDGHRTWINGPNGLKDRLNTQRLPWEPDAAAFAPRPAPAPAPEPAPLVPGTQLGLPVSGPTLTMTPTAFGRVPGEFGAAGGPGARLVKVTVKVESGNGGNNRGRLGQYDYWDFRLRDPQGVEYRPSVLDASRPGALSRGTLVGSQFVVGDVYFAVPADEQVYGLHVYPSGHSNPSVAISRWLGAAA